ncbi:MAG: hypothetical protein L0Z50_25850 [Verrucomicrobiales bacterium]|nr:hypothetical protein [Verrucomicrobiales bacterium]
MLKAKTFLLAAMTARLTRLAGAVAFVLAVAPGVWAQQAAAQKPGNVARVFFVTAKPGAESDYEAGRKRHMEAHKKMGDTWSWYTYQTETGEDAGSYATVTFGHHWADFDTWEEKNGEADVADGAKNLDPFTAGGGNSFFMFLADVSTPPSATPSAMAELIHFELKIGGDQDFNAALKKTHEAIQKTKWASNYQWYTLANGGSGPRYVLAIPLKGFADMEPPAVPFPAMLEKALGAAGAKEVMAAFDRTIARQYSEMIRYRPDLSYVPEKK